MFRQVLVSLLLLQALAPHPAVAERGRSRDRSADIEELILELAIDLEAGRVAGTATLNVRGLRDRTVELDLDAVELEIDEVRVDGSPVSFRHDGERLAVPFDAPLAAGARARIDVDYSASPRAGLLFVRPDPRYPGKQLECWSQGEAEDNRRWFPVFDHPSERLASETRIRVAKPLKVVGNGRLLDVHDHGDGTWTWTHRLDFPHVPYLVSLAIGDWATTTEQWRGVTLEYNVPKALAAQASRTFAHTAAFLESISEHSGLPYPWPVYRQTCVHEFLFGGMENITAVTLTANTLHDERAEPDTSSDSLIAHEAAHQWFGDYVTLHDWSEAWLNEGFATYFASLAEADLRGPEHFCADMERNRASALSADAGDKRRPLVSDDYEDPFDLFDGHAYAKGAMVLHALRRELGDPDFRRAVKHYLESCGGRSVRSQDLATAIEEATGRDMSRFFAQWVHGAGQPELEVSWERSQGGVEVTVAQVQERSELVGLFDVPLDLLVLGEDWTLERSVRLDEEVESFHYETPGEPWAVLVDPEGWLLRTLEIDRSTREAARVLREAPRLLPRIEAARELQEKAGGRRAEEALSAALSDADEHWAVRGQAAEALGHGRGAASRAALLAALRADSEPRVRTAAASALKGFEQREVGSGLRAALRGDSSYKVRAAAARSLGSSQGRGAAAELERALSQDSHDDVVVRAALDGLHEAKAQGLRRLLLSWTGRGRPERARDHAIGLLAKIARDSRDEDEREEITDRLMELLDDPLVRTRDAAVVGLGEMRAERSRSALEAIRADSALSRLRRSARAALEKLDRPQDASCEGLTERVEALEQALALREEEGE